VLLEIEVEVEREMSPSDVESEEFNTSLRI